MKIGYWFIALALCSGAPLVFSQDPEISVDDAVRLGQQFVDENVDPAVVKQFDQLSGPSRDFLAQLQAKLNSDYIVDLAGLKKTATKVMPLLESNEETLPFAAWLKTRMDYLDAADQFRKMTPPPKVEIGKAPPVSSPQPTAAMERKVWGKLIDKRPVPKEAEPFIAKLKVAFAANGVPEELVWLAEEESCFNPEARSPEGAAGLFQLMPNTAKSLGLSTWWPDERLDTEKSGPAAAKYLKAMHGRFKDWKLALAAYNVGPGRLDRLMQKHNAKTFEEVSPWLPAETQMYVPKFEALLQKREGMTLADLKSPVKME